MTKKMSHILLVTVALFILIIFASADAFASAIVYDNTSTVLGWSVGGSEIGDEINLAGTCRTVTEFKFDVLLQVDDPGSDPKAIVRFYRNDGPGGEPNGIEFYRSGEVVIVAGWNILSGLSVQVPDTFTWTVQLYGFVGDDYGHLVLYDPPAVGSSDDYYWSWDYPNPHWNKLTLTGPVDNLGAQVVAVDMCEGDFDGDGDVDGSDLAVFAADFGRTDCGTGDTCEGDFDSDSDVDGSDLAVFAADFGRTDCPRELRITVIDEFSFLPGYPHGLAFDGNYLWCVANGEDKIYKLNIDGSVVSSISSPGPSPTGLTFDGTYLWNSDDNSLEIYQLDTSGSMLGSFNAPGGDSTGLTFDGTYLWNADFTSGGKIHKINTSGTLVGSFDSPGNGPEGLAYDETYLWNVDIYENKIYKLDMYGNVINSCSSPGSRPIGLTFDGTYFWLADQGLSKIYKLSIE